MIKMQPVRAVQDQDSHWYVIPKELFGLFYAMEENGKLDEWESFNEKFSEYRTDGDLNLIQLFAEI